MKYKFLFIVFLINFNFIFPADFEPQGMTLEQIAQEHERRLSENDESNELNSEKKLKHDFVKKQKIKKEKISDEILTCNNCNAYETCDRRNFSRHVKACKNLRLYQCKYCEKRFNYSSSLKEHIDWVHSDERDFHCEECDYSGRTRDALKKHCINKHSNKTFFKCHFCEHKDKMKGNFRRHLLTQHFFCWRCKTQYNSREEAVECDESHKE